MTSYFIAFEGGDASGKTTQAKRVANRFSAVLTREPGGTPLGEILRRLVLEPETKIDARAEALIIAAARAQHVEEVISPALKSGRNVVVDRFIGSSLAYQGFGSGLDVTKIGNISDFATASLWPDLTLLLDVPVEVSMNRLGSQADRFEREETAFHDRVRAGYLELAADDAKWVVINGIDSVEEVAANVDEAITTHLKLG